MMRSLLLVLACSACATLPLRAEDASTVVVSGHVTSSCKADSPLPNQDVTLRAAGELEALQVTQTDGEGAFLFEVTKEKAELGSFLIEAKGVRAVAKPKEQKLVAELAVPCGG